MRTDKATHGYQDNGERYVEIIFSKLSCPQTECLMVHSDIQVKFICILNSSQNFIKNIQFHYPLQIGHHKHLQGACMNKKTECPNQKTAMLHKLYCGQCFRNI